MQCGTCLVVDDDDDVDDDSFDLVWWPTNHLLKTTKPNQDLSFWNEDEEEEKCLIINGNAYL